MADNPFLKSLGALEKYATSVAAAGAVVVAACGANTEGTVASGVCLIATVLYSAAPWRMFGNLTVTDAADLKTLELYKLFHKALAMGALVGLVSFISVGLAMSQASKRAETWLLQTTAASDFQAKYFSENPRLTYDGFPTAITVAPPDTATDQRVKSSLGFPHFVVPAGKARDLFRASPLFQAAAEGLAERLAGGFSLFVVVVVVMMFALFVGDRSLAGKSNPPASQ